LLCKSKFYFQYNTKSNTNNIKLTAKFNSIYCSETGNGIRIIDENYHINNTVSVKISECSIYKKFLMYSVNLNFKNKQAYNKFKRNVKKGKGTNLKASDIEGEGIFDVVQGIATSKVTKGIVKALAPAVTSAITAKTGSPLAGQIANAGINAYRGSGILDILKKVGNSKVTKGVAKALAPAIVDQVKKQTGSNLAGDVAGVAVKSYAGSGVGQAGQTGVALPSNVLPSSDINDDIKATMRKKMANVRSHRKKKGGSVLPLGSK
jgi:hypothetical protein